MGALKVYGAVTVSVSHLVDRAAARSMINY